jgi:hypothetical protein
MDRAEELGTRPIGATGTKGGLAINRLVSQDGESRRADLFFRVGVGQTSHQGSRGQRRHFGGGVKGRRDVVVILIVERVQTAVGVQIDHHLAGQDRYALEFLAETHGPFPGNPEDGPVHDIPESGQPVKETGGLPQDLARQLSRRKGSGHEGSEQGVEPAPERAGKGV